MDSKSKKVTLEEERKKMLSDESIDLFKKVILEIGNELQKMKIKCEVKARVKSEKSFNKKEAEKINDEKSNNFRIYDNLGIEIIIDEIPEDMAFYNDSVVNTKTKNEGKKQNKLDRIQILSEKSKAEFNLKKCKRELEHETSENEIALKKEKYNNSKKSYDDIEYLYQHNVEKYLRAYIMQALDKNISEIDERNKDHSKYRYKAYHTSFSYIDPKLSQNIISELQITNRTDYKRADVKDHSERPGKKRILPAEPENSLSGMNTFKRILKNEVPRQFIYINDKKTVYECSELENFMYFFCENFRPITEEEYFMKENEKNHEEESIKEVKKNLKKLGWESDDIIKIEEELIENKIATYNEYKRIKAEIIKQLENSNCYKMQNEDLLKIIQNEVEKETNFEILKNKLSKKYNNDENKINEEIKNRIVEYYKIEKEAPEKMKKDRKMKKEKFKKFLYNLKDDNGKETNIEPEGARKIIKDSKKQIPNLQMDYSEIYNNKNKEEKEQ